MQEYNRKEDEVQTMFGFDETESERVYKKYKRIAEDLENSIRQFRDYEYNVESFVEDTKQVYVDDSVASGKFYLKYCSKQQNVQERAEKIAYKLNDVIYEYELQLDRIKSLREQYYENMQAEQEE